MVWVRRFELTTAIILLCTRYAGVKENSRISALLFFCFILFLTASKGVKGKTNGKVDSYLARPPPISIPVITWQTEHSITEGKKYEQSR